MYNRRLAQYAAASSGGGWSPAALGSSLLAWWDAERSDLITQSGGLVSSWKDIVTGADAAQSSGSLKPAYSATGFNGRPVLNFDGTDDQLSIASPPATLPIGAAACELWVAVNQTALGSDVNNRFAFSYGANVSTDNRSIERVSTTSNNRANVRCGNGTSAFSSSQGTVDFSGLHIERAVIDGANIWVEIDGIASTPTACVPASTATRCRIGANSGSSPGNYWQGGINSALVTGLLSAANATLLYNYLNTRRV